MVVVHQDTALRFSQDVPCRKDGIERKGWIAERPRLVDAHDGQVFDRHPDPTIHHFVVLNRHFSSAVVVRDRALKNGGFVHDIGEGECIKDVADACLGFAGDGRW